MSAEYTEQQKFAARVMFGFLPSCLGGETHRFQKALNAGMFLAILKAI